MKQFLSYIVGVAVALGLVFGLFMGRYFSSSAYAREQQEKVAVQISLAEIEEILDDEMRTDRHVYAAALVHRTDALEDRIRLLAKTACDDDLTIRSYAELALQEIGEAALPKIGELLKAEDSRRISWGCGGITALGPLADQYGERVCEILRKGNFNDKRSAMFALQRLSPEVAVNALDDVIAQLDDEDFNTQCIACRVLHNIGPDAKPAVSRLIQLIDEGNVSSRSRAAMALAAIGPVEGVDIVGILQERLECQSAIERARVLDAIGLMGPDAKSALQKVESLMYATELRVMPQAALAHYNISGNAKVSIGVLKNLLDSRTYRLIAAECIGGMGQGGEAGVPELMKMLGEEDENAIETAVLALKGIGPAAANALPSIRPLLKHDDYLISKAAMEAINAIDPK